MRPDPGRFAQEALLANMPATRRAAIAAELRERGIALAWQQADAAGITDPVEQAGFLLRRLYPEMPERWFNDAVTKLAALRAIGTWNGFERPPEVER